MSSYSAQQSSISENNRSRILQYLYHNGISSRAQIAKAIELTPAAITKITAKLLFRDVIEETGDMEGDKNRRSIGLNLNCAKYHVVGVKFARSLVQIAVFDLKCNRISLTDLPTVDEEHIPETVEQIRATVRQLIADDSSIVAVGMAVPGPYLVEEGRTALVSSMQGWRQVNFIKEFSEAFNVPVFVEQDARAGALAQFLFNPELSEGSLAYYLLGEGIGLGIIDNGSIYYGAHGTATEIGHISVDVNGKPCDCGNIGCLERYCSANAIHERLNEQPSIVPGCEAMTHAQACTALFAKAAAGDKAAMDLTFRGRSIYRIWRGQYHHAFNPDGISVLGDIISQAGQPLLNEVKKVVRERTIPEVGHDTKITLSNLPTDATVSGAAAVAITNFLEHPSMFFDVA